VGVEGDESSHTRGEKEEQGEYKSAHGSSTATTVMNGDTITSVDDDGSTSSTTFSLAELHEPLVLRMMDFFSHGGRNSIPPLNQLALVCRRWCTLARASTLWAPIAQQVWPVLDAGSSSSNGSSGGGGGTGSSTSLGLDFFTLVKQRGKALSPQPNVTLLPPRWTDFYRLSFEVYDARDNFCILCGQVRRESGQK